MASPSSSASSARSRSPGCSIVFDPLFARNFEPRGILFAAAAMFAIGLIDDIRDISAPAKVAGTVLVAVISRVLRRHDVPLPPAVHRRAGS